MTEPFRRVVAKHDPALAARVVRTVALRYAAGADPSLDRPAHVRAGSGLAWWGDRLVVAQDDANFIALVDPADGLAHGIALPAAADGMRQFDDSRGNKHLKLDLESLVAVPGADHIELQLLAFASGSTSRREFVVTVRGRRDGADSPRVALVHVPSLYAGLRECASFAGSELNVEGAVFLNDDGGPRIQLFNRGNGAATGEREAVNATCQLAWPDLRELLESPASQRAPNPINVVQFELGAMDSCPLSFTDAAATATATATRCTLYTAAAEASPDAIRDGPVRGSAIGVITEHPDGVDARYAPLFDESGELVTAKVEGIAINPTDSTRAFVVIDSDTHDLPSILCEVVLIGDWFARG